MANIKLDVEGGNNSNDGSSFAQRVATLTRASELIGPGDQLQLMASPAPNSLGVNGTFVRGSTKITLASAVTQLLFAGSASGTVSSNVTYTSTTTRKSSTAYAQIAIGSSFTTGKAWYYDFGATDLSGYQQLSFWIQMTTGTLAANLSFRICSDATGDVSVNTFTIPACGATNQWHRVTIPLGGAMSSSARTLALYVDSDQGAQTVIIGNINACKAAGTGELHLKSFIGKHDSLGAGGDDSETWYPIRAIEGTTVTLDLQNSSSAGSTTNGRFWGDSETVTAYSMVPCWLPVTNAATDNYLFAAGTSGSRITVSGGWNRTDMSTQTGKTWLAIQSAPSNVGVTVMSSNIDISDVHFGLFTGALSLAGESISINTHCVNGASAVVIGASNEVGLTMTNPANSISLGGVGHEIALTLHSDSTNVSVANLCVGSELLMSGVFGQITASPNQTADHVIRRNMANVFASSDGDDINISSLYGCTQQAQKFNRSTGVVKNTDGSTLHTFTISTDDALEPVEEIS